MRCHETSETVDGKLSVHRYFAIPGITKKDIKREGNLATISDVKYLNIDGNITQDHNDAECLAIAIAYKRAPLQIEVSDFYNLLSLEDQRQPEEVKELIGKRLYVYFGGTGIFAFSTLGTEWNRMNELALTAQNSLEKKVTPLLDDSSVSK